MRIIHSALVLLAGLLLVFPACAVNPPVTSPDKTVVEATVTPETKSPAVSFAPSSPIKVNLSISKLPVLNEQVDLTCNVTSHSDASNSTAQIRLSKGASLISGNLEWQGDLKANIPVSFSAQIVFKETGHQTIEATATHIIDDKNGYGWGDLDAIYLDIGSESSTFGWLASPVAVARVPDKWSVIETDLEISHAPKLNEPAKLFVTVLSPVDLPDLTAEIIFHQGIELLEGTKRRPVDLEAGVPVHFSAIIVFRETGYRTVTADVAELVNGVWHHSPQDTIYLKIGINESIFEREPQIETPPENLPPPPPAPLP